MEAKINNKTCIQGTEYVENHCWVSCGKPRNFIYFVYKVNGDENNEKSTFRTVGRSLQVCRERLAEWAERKKLELIGTKTVKVKAV